MFQRAPIFDLLKIMYLCSKVSFLHQIYMEVYKAMNKKMFPSILKQVNQAAIALPSRYADLSFYSMVSNKRTLCATEDSSSGQFLLASSGRPQNRGRLETKIIGKDFFQNNYVDESRHFTKKLQMTKIFKREANIRIQRHFWTISFHFFLPTLGQPLHRI